MRDANTGLLVEIDPHSNVTDLLAQHAKDPFSALYARKGPAGWDDVTTARSWSGESASSR